MKKIRKSFIFTSLLYMALGIVLLVWPDISLNVVCFSFGVVTLLYGVVKLFMYVANTFGSRGNSNCFRCFFSYETRYYYIYFPNNDWFIYYFP